MYSTETTSLTPTESGNDTDMSLKVGKIYDWKTLVANHTQFAMMLPCYLLSYIGFSSRLDPAITESVMVTMNSHNTCPYCTGLHGQLARMAGLSEPDPSDPHVVYAKTFALESGRGGDVEAAYAKLVDVIGAAKARNVRALCWALLWGKTTGNSINAARDKILTLKLTKVTLLDIFVLAYYGPLFIVIGLLNAALTIMPAIPKGASAALGVVLWVPQALNILPLGLLSIILSLGVV